MRIKYKIEDSNLAKMVTMLPKRWGLGDTAPGTLSLPGSSAILLMSFRREREDRGQPTIPCPLFYMANVGKTNKQITMVFLFLDCWGGKQKKKISWHKDHMEFTFQAPQIVSGSQPQAADIVHALRLLSQHNSRVDTQTVKKTSQWPHIQPRQGRGLPTS